jgi:hypothetical protein
MILIRSHALPIARALDLIYLQVMYVLSNKVQGRTYEFVVWN